MAAAASPSTVTKCHGAGPRQYQTSPVTSSSISAERGADVADKGGTRRRRCDDATIEVDAVEPDVADDLAVVLVEVQEGLRAAVEDAALLLGQTIERAQ